MYVICNNNKLLLTQMTAYVVGEVGLTFLMTRG